MIPQLCGVFLAIHENCQMVTHCHLCSPGSLCMALGMTLQAWATVSRQSFKIVTQLYCLELKNQFNLSFVSQFKKKLIS